MSALAATLVLALAASPASSGPRAYAWVPLVVSGAAIAGGATFLFISARQVDAAAKLEPEPAAALLSEATNNRVGGVMLLVLAGLSAGISVYLFQFEPRVSLGFAPTPGGAAFSLGWRL